MKGLPRCVLLVSLGCAADPGPKPKMALAPHKTVYRDEPVKPQSSADQMQMWGSGALGTLTPFEIEEPIRKRWKEISQCWTRQERRLPRYVAGTVQLEFRVDRAGKVSRVVIEENGLGSWPIERCVLDVARTLRFPEPDGGEVEFEYPIEFRKPHAAEVEYWSPRDIQEGITRQASELGECFQDVSSVPSFELSLYINRRGLVASAGIATARPLDDDLVDCVVAKVQSWDFQKPEKNAAFASYRFR